MVSFHGVVLWQSIKNVEKLLCGGGAGADHHHGPVPYHTFSITPTLVK